MLNNRNVTQHKAHKCKFNDKPNCQWKLRAKQFFVCRFFRVTNRLNRQQPTICIPKQAIECEGGEH